MKLCSEFKTGVPSDDLISSTQLKNVYYIEKIILTTYLPYAYVVRRDVMFSQISVQFFFWGGERRYPTGNMFFTGGYASPRWRGTPMPGQGYPSPR